MQAIRKRYFPALAEYIRSGSEAMSAGTPGQATAMNQPSLDEVGAVISDTTEKDSLPGGRATDSVGSHLVGMVPGAAETPVRAEEAPVSQLEQPSARSAEPAPAFPESARQAISVPAPWALRLSVLRPVLLRLLQLSAPLPQWAQSVLLAGRAPA